MSLRTVVYEDGPEYEPETSDGSEHVEDRLPSEVLAEVSGGRHGDHGAKWSPSADEGGEPDYQENIYIPER